MNMIANRWNLFPKCVALNEGFVALLVLKASYWGLLWGLWYVLNLNNSFFPAAPGCCTVFRHRSASPLWTCTSENIAAALNHRRCWKQWCDRKKHSTEQYSGNSLETDSIIPQLPVNLKGKISTGTSTETQATDSEGPLEFNTSLSLIQTAQLWRTTLQSS